MSTKSKKIDSLLDSIRDSQGLTDSQFRLLTIPSVSPSKLEPLDFGSFGYKGNYFFALFIPNNRTGQGSVTYMNNNTRNTLVSCFTLEGVSPESLQAILSSLYRIDPNALRKVASYRYMKNLFSLLLGKRSYKTFNKLFMGRVTITRAI